MMNFSFQLYSARNFTPWTDFIRKLSQMGYAQVEGFAGCFDDIDGLRAVLDETGLTMPTSHYGLDDLEKDPQAAIDLARKLGVKHLYAPYLMAEDRPTDRAGWSHFAKRLAEAGKQVNDAGLKFGWHNHDFEFELTKDGALPMQILLEEAPDIAWEIDVAWVIKGGVDAFEWIETHKDRITSAHVKDIAPVGEKEDEDGWADVGDGTMNWPALLTALKATNCEYFIAEHDNPSDGTRFASRSLSNLNAMET